MWVCALVSALRRPPPRLRRLATARRPPPLDERSTWVLDGGLSTQLELHHGVDLARDHPRSWTAGLLADAAGRETLGLAHGAFARAGADLVLSASYQATLDGRGGAEALAESVALAARAAAGAGARAWASVGPYGATRADGSEYTGELPEDVDDARLGVFHRARLEALLGGANEAGAPRAAGVAFETIPSLREARVLLGLVSAAEAADAAAPLARLASLPVWLSFQCRPLGDGAAAAEGGARLADGTPLAAAAREAAAALARRGADAYVGVNCVSPDVVDVALDALVPAAAAAGLAGVVVYPNDGGAWDAAARAWVRRPEDGEPFARARAAAWRDRIVGAGLRAIVGGCCSTEESTVAQLRATLLGR